MSNIPMLQSMPTVVSMPQPSEYEYIGQLILERWWVEVEQVVHPLQDRVCPLLLEGQYKEAQRLEQQVSCLLQELMDKRTRSEDILHWLKLDSELRQESVTTLPDFFETKKEARLFDEEF